MSNRRIHHTLRRFELTDTLGLRRLVRANSADLATDFPGVVERYGGSRWDAFRAVRRAQSNPNLAAYTARRIEHDLEDQTLAFSICIGVVTLGKATLVPESVSAISTGTAPEALAGTLVAGWLDREHRQQGVARELGPKVLDLIKQHGWGPGLTMIRPDNAASVRLAEAHGFEPIGQPADYSGQAGDAVSVPRQLYAQTAEVYVQGSTE